MTDQSAPTAQAEPTPAVPPRQGYTPPRLVVHGTVQSLTQDTGGTDNISGPPTA